MKKLVAIAALFALLSCSSSKFYSKSVSLLDFRPYTEKGFMMSSTNIAITYQTIGVIEVRCESGYIKNEKQLWGFNELETKPALAMNVSAKTPQKQWSTDEVLAELYNEGKAIGANGIINITIETNYSEGFKDFIIRGLAVKLEN